MHRGSALPPEEEARLRAALVEALPDLRMADLFRHRPDLVRSCERLLVARGDGDAVLGVLGGRDETTVADGLRAQPFLHVIVQMIAPAARRTPLFAEMWSAFLHGVAATDGMPAVVAFKTYNPIAFLAMRAFAGLPEVEMYPRLESGPPRAVDELAPRIAQRLAPGRPFDPRTGVIGGIGVPRDLYRERPTCRSRVLDAHFARVLRPGDRMLCVLSMPTEAARARVLGALPPPREAGVDPSRPTAAAAAPATGDGRGRRR